MRRERTWRRKRRGGEKSPKEFDATMEEAKANVPNGELPVRVMAGPTNPMVTPLLTDLYQFTMAYAYWKAGKHNDRAVWVLLCISLPSGIRSCLVPEKIIIIIIFLSFVFLGNQNQSLFLIHIYILFNDLIVVILIVLFIRVFIFSCSYLGFWSLSSETLLKFLS